MSGGDLIQVTVRRTHAGPARTCTTASYTCTARQFDAMPPGALETKVRELAARTEPGDRP